MGKTQKRARVFSQEFKDAIESLSPEQKRFATAIRAMQLESSVFGQKKSVFCATFIQNRSFYQDRLGINIGKSTQKT